MSYLDPRGAMGDDGVVVNTSDPMPLEEPSFLDWITGGMWTNRGEEVSAAPATTLPSSATTPYTASAPKTDNIQTYVKLSIIALVGVVLYKGLSK